MKVLSIDGGGVKGVFPAAFLATVEDVINDRVVNYFDLIVGTSTGGIIAIGLGLGLSAQEIVDLYLTDGPNIFAGSRFWRWLRHFGVSKYSSRPLREALEKRIGQRPLGESLTRLVIPSVNVFTGEVHIFKTSHLPRFHMDYKEPALTAAMATSAAPSFFPTYWSETGMPLVDGGLYANNPVGLAVVEAVGVLGWQPEELQVLSLGCTVEALDIRLGLRRAMGFLYWGKNAITLMMAAQSQASLGTAYHLAGKERVIRINPPVPPRRFGLDVVKDLDLLRGLGATQARAHLPELEDRFFAQRAEAFQPYKPV